MLKIVLKRVIEKIEEAKESDLIEDFLSRLKIGILHRFTNHYTDINMNLSTFPDPRFKTKFIEEIFRVDQISMALEKEYQEIIEKKPGFLTDCSKMEDLFLKENSKV